MRLKIDLCGYKIAILASKLLWLSMSAPEPVERFSLNFGQMFASVKRCAKPITQSCRLKVKVTIEGPEFESLISDPFHITFTSGLIFIKLWSNVRLSETMFRTHKSTMPTQGQAHN